jgi:hypothetical protein
MKKKCISKLECVKGLEIEHVYNNVLTNFITIWRCMMGWFKVQFMAMEVNGSTCVLSKFC